MTKLQENCLSILKIFFCTQFSIKPALKLNAKKLSSRILIKKKFFKFTNYQNQKKVSNIESFFIRVNTSIFNSLFKSIIKNAAVKKIIHHRFSHSKCTLFLLNRFTQSIFFISNSVIFEFLYRPECVLLAELAG